MTDDEVLSCALELARDNDRDLDEYDEPMVERDGEEWIVFFQGREQRPGHHFMVVVDGETGRGRFVDGR